MREHTSTTPGPPSEHLGDLATWSFASVAPHPSEVAFVPDENAGVLSHQTRHSYHL
jgi:hypothetical protein